MDGNQFPERDEDLLTMMRRWEQESVDGAQEEDSPAQAAGGTALEPAPALKPPVSAAAESLLRELEQYDAPQPAPPVQSVAPMRPAIPPTQPIAPPMAPAPGWPESYHNPWAAPPTPMPRSMPQPVPRPVPQPIPRPAPNGAPRGKAVQAADAWYQAEANPPRPAAQPRPATQKREPQTMNQMQNAQNTQNVRQTQNTQRAQTPKKKKGNGVKRFFSMFLVIVLLISAGSYALVYLAAGKVEYRAMPQEDARAVAAIPSKMMITNILLIGVDGRFNTGVRSDTMLLLTIDRSHRKLKMTSFLRDTWAAMPGAGQDRLNAAFGKGGASATLRTISQIYNIHIDHYVLLNYTTFEKVIDAIDGVDVAITDAEADFLCKNTRLGKQIGRESMRQQMEQKGAVHLNGVQALIYCRIRKLDDDLQRTQRQRKTLESIMQKCKKDPRLWLKAAQYVLPEIETDMNQFNLTNLAMGAPLYLTYTIAQHQVPSSGTFTYATINGASVIKIKEDCVELNKQQLKSFVEQS